MRTVTAILLSSLVMLVGCNGGPAVIPTPDPVQEPGPTQNVPKTDRLCLRWPAAEYEGTTLVMAELELVATEEALPRTVRGVRTFDLTSLFIPGGEWHSLPLLEALSALPPATISLRVRVCDGKVWSDWSEAIVIRKEW